MKAEEAKKLAVELKQHIRELVEEVKANLSTRTSIKLDRDWEETELTYYWDAYNRDWTTLECRAIKGGVLRKISDLIEL